MRSRTMLLAPVLLVSMFAIARRRGGRRRRAERARRRLARVRPRSRRHRYSPLDQIDGWNFGKLEIAWRWESISKQVTEANPTVRAGEFKVVPIMAGGLLYVGTEVSQVAAIDPATGKTVWSYDPESWKDGRPANVGFQHRGVSYWTDGKEGRVFIATHDRRLIALDAKTGKPIESFGTGGAVDLLPNGGVDHFGRKINKRHITHSSPPAIVRDTVVVGSIVHDGPTHKTAPPGFVRGFDARTGKLKWIFRTIPQPGEVGNETWENESWSYSGAANVWSMMAVDPELGYVYLPTGTPTNDMYGGHRLGDNLFAESIICLDAETGKRVWHFQAVHHGLWDYDFPTSPILTDITVDGKRIKALAQVSKQAFTYVLDRTNGKPVWPIEERPVPQSSVPGERTSPTQPFPTKPAAFDLQGTSEAMLNDLTPELKAEAIEIAKQYQVRAALHAADARRRGQAGPHAAERGRRRQLAGRRVRSRDRHPLRAVDRPRCRPSR